MDAICAAASLSGGTPAAVGPCLFRGAAALVGPWGPSLPTRMMRALGLSMHGGNLWDIETRPATIQFKVIGESGVSKLQNSNMLVSKPDGSESYLCTAKDLTVIVSTDCTIRFMTRGGSEIENMIVQYGEKLKRPDDPTREGFVFDGWYKDIDLTAEWNFDSDVVQGNMSLYAKWIEGVLEVTPESEQHTKWFPWWISLLLLLLVIALYLWKRYSEKNRT